MLDPKHSTCSALVRSWRAKQVRPQPDHDKVDLSTTETLKFPGEGFVIAVYFSKVIGHPDVMWVSSTNWRAEDEPRGFYTIGDARDFWRKLVSSGMVRQER